MNVSERAEKVAQTALRYGLYLDPADIVTKGLPDGWAIIPRHWGFDLYDYTIISPCCNGWSGGEMQRKRRTIRAARKAIAQHCAECARVAS